MEEKKTEKSCGSCELMKHEDSDGFGICSAVMPQTISMAFHRNRVTLPLSELRITYAGYGKDCPCFQPKLPDTPEPHLTEKGQ